MKCYLCCEKAMRMAMHLDMPQVLPDFLLVPFFLPVASGCNYC